jgi:hypothetical protein
MNSCGFVSVESIFMVSFLLCSVWLATLSLFLPASFVNPLDTLRVIHESPKASPLSEVAGTVHENPWTLVPRVVARVAEDDVTISDHDPSDLVETLGTVNANVVTLAALLEPDV